MKKFLLLFLPMLFAISAAVGQENYQKGYVVTLKGDTIHGFINYRNWGINPGHIKFESAQNGAKTVYRPLEIKAFFVHEELYLSGIVKSEKSFRTDLSLMSDSAQVQTRTDTAFLRVLASGHPSLLFYKNDLNIENFYLMANGKIHLLEYKKYIAEGNPNNPNTRNYLKENKKYIGQLMVYLEACPRIRPQISFSQYTSSSLVKLFQNYYKCMHENTSYVTKVAKVKVKLGVVAGLLNSNVKFSGYGYAASGIKFSTSENFTGGIVVDLVMPRNLHEWSLHNEISYTSLLISGTSSQSIMKFGYSSVSLTDLVRFTYSFGKVSAFVNAGISNGIVMNYTNKITYTKLVVGEYEYAVPPSVLMKRDIGWAAGLGLDYKNATFEVRGNRMSGFSGAPGVGIGVRQVSFLVGYTF